MGWGLLPVSSLLAAVMVEAGAAIDRGPTNLGIVSTLSGMILHVRATDMNTEDVPDIVVCRTFSRLIFTFAIRHRNATCKSTKFSPAK